MDHNFIDIIFSKPPQPPCTYEIVIDNVLNKGISLFKFLMHVLISGAKKLYGENITADDITESQLYTLQEYINSIGYIIKYNFTNPITNVRSTIPLERPCIINIWFEKYIPSYNCHGNIIY